MMNKNLKLLALAVALTAGSDLQTMNYESERYESPETEFPKMTEYENGLSDEISEKNVKERNSEEQNIQRRNSENFEMRSSVRSSVSNQDYFVEMTEQSLVEKAQEKIGRAFEAMEDWIRKPALYSHVGSSNGLTFVSDGRGGSIYQGENGKISPFYENPISGEVTAAKNYSVKLTDAMNYMEQALDNLGASINTSSEGMKAVKETVGRAMRSFATQSNFGETISARALSGIVNSVKIVMLAPVKLAVQYASMGVGMAAGGVGGASVGFGAGISRTYQGIERATRRRYSQEFNVHDREFNWKAESALSYAVKVIPRTIVATLHGVVSTAVLTAYAAVEGIAVGGLVGSIQGANMTGKVWSLPTQEKRAEMERKRSEKNEQRDREYAKRQEQERFEREYRQQETARIASQREFAKQAEQAKVEQVKVERENKARLKQERTF